MKNLKESLYHWEGKVKDKLASLILPNGYGYLKYIDGIQKELINISKDVYLSILSGQNGHNGILNIEQGSKDVENSVKMIKQKVNLICHCSSFMFINEIQSNTFWDKIDKVVLYSYLSNPISHFKRFKKKSLLYGVKMNQNELKLKKYSNPQVYANIPAPIYVIHPKTAMNRVRANSTELKKLAKNSNIISITEPELGYEISPETQEFETNYIVSNYFSKII